MPRTTVQDERRAALIEAATAIISRDGVDAATVREVAAAAGFSTKVVSRYFVDKRELLLLVYRAGAERHRNRLMAARLEHGDDIVACAESLLPIDDARRTEWAIVLAFWGMAITDAAFQREQRHRVRSARQFLSAVVENAIVADELPEHLDAAKVATEVLTVVTGIAVQVMFDPSGWSPGQQRSLIRDVVTRAVSR